MDEEISPEKAERLKQVLEYVTELLMKAGWLQSAAHTKDAFGLAWTPKGGERAKQLRAIFDELGAELTGEEMTNLLVIIDNTSPGNVDGAPGHRP